MTIEMIVIVILMMMMMMMVMIIMVIKIMMMMVMIIAIKSHPANRSCPLFSLLGNDDGDDIEKLFEKNMVTKRKILERKDGGIEN